MEGGGMNAEIWLSHADETGVQRELQRAIWNELRWERETATADVHVNVEDFVARLTGSVPSYRARVAMQQAAERVPRVRAVLNRLTVDLPPGDARADSVLAAAVANALLWDVRVPHTRLTEHVIEGWVTLGGAVARHAERDAAEDIVANLTGVRGVTNQITIDPEQQPAALRRQAEEAIDRCAMRGARIQVDAHDRTIALSGHVHSLAERRAVVRAAWAIPGVETVQDLVTIR